MQPDELPTPSRGPGAGGQYLVFCLADEEYGVGISDVREIVPVPPVTRVPRAPPAVRGVVNLRGKILPVIDLRDLLGMPPRDDDPQTCIVVVGVRGMLVGVSVDRVCEVASITSDEIGAAPPMGSDVTTQHIVGVTVRTARARILLDVEELLARSLPQGELRRA